MAHQTGLNPAKALVDCFQGSCQDDKRCAGFPICDSGLAYPPSSDPTIEACANCLGAKCCAELTACANDADMSCLDCFNNPMGTNCSTDMLGTAANNCRSMNCAMECL